MNDQKRVIIEKWELVLIGILVIFMLVLGNPLRWIVSLIILGLLGFNMVNHIRHRTENMDVWKRENELDDIVHLHISRISEVTKNAYYGKKLSRGILEEYLTDEFIEKMKDKRNLTDSEIDYLLDHPDDLKKVIRDDELTDFILKAKSLKKVLQKDYYGSDKKEKKFFEKEKLDKAYKNKINRLVKKMEEWN